MIIKSIKLSNFISHGNTEIEFPYGVSVFLGENGSGKSSIIDAIFYSLCGEQVRGDTIDDLIKEGYNEAEITLKFQHNGIQYEVERKRDRDKGPKAVLKEDGIIIANSQNAVNNEIYNILEMDKNAILNSVFIRQGEITKLIDGRPAERKKAMGKLVGIDRLEKSYENMLKVINFFEKQSKEFEVIHKELEISQQRREEIASEISKLMKELQTLKERLLETESLHENSKHQKDIWEKKRIDYERITKEISVLEVNLTSSGRELERLSNRLKESHKAKSKMDELYPRIANIDVLENLTAKKKEEVSIAKDLNHIEEELKKISQMQSNLKRNFTSYKSYGEKNKELKSQKKVVEKLRGVKVEYAEVMSEIKNSKDGIINLKNDVNEIREIALQYLSKADIKTKDIYLQRLSKRVSDVVSELTKLENQMGRLNGRILEIRNYIEKLKTDNRCPVCSSELTSNRKSEITNDFTSEKTSIIRQLEVSKVAIEKLRDEESSLRRELEKMNKLEIDKIPNKIEHIQKLEQQLEGFERQRVEKEKSLNELSSLEKAVKIYEEEINKLQTGYDEYNAAVLALSQAPSEKVLRQKHEKISKGNKEIIDSILNLTKQIKKVPSEPEKELKELRNLKEEYERLSVKYEELKQLSLNIQKTEKDIKNISNNLAKLRESNRILDYDQEQYHEVLDIFREFETHITNFNTNIAAKKLGIGIEQLKLEEVETNIKHLDEKLADLYRINKLKVLLEKIRGAFSKDGIQKALRKKITPYLTDFARENLEAFDLNISDIEINEDLGISLLGRNGKVSVKSISGGEKVAIAIVLRLAIARILSSQISTIIMDEPTTHLDPERRKELVKAMQNFKRESSTVPQLIVVTHHKELEDLGDNIFEVGIKNNASEVREIEQF